MIFLEHPSTWILLAIVLIVGSVRGVTKAGTAGLACYAASFALSNAYSYVPYVEAVLFWQGGLLALLALYCIVGRQFWLAPLAAISIGLYMLDITSRYGMEFILSALITIAVFSIYQRLAASDIFARMVWGVVLIFEGWSAMEIPGCRVFAKIDYAAVAELWQRTGGASVCEIAFGPIAPYFITGITLTLLAWIRWRWNQTAKYGN